MSHSTCSDRHDSAGGMIDRSAAAAEPRAVAGRLIVHRYLLQHVHTPEECGSAFASFRGHDSPLRRQPTIASCLFGGHAIWWDVRAASEAEALRLLPYYVAHRTVATVIADVEIP